MRIKKFVHQLILVPFIFLQICFSVQAAPRRSTFDEGKSTFDETKFIALRQKAITKIQRGNLIHDRNLARGHLPQVLNGSIPVYAATTGTVVTIPLVVGADDNIAIYFGGPVSVGTPLQGFSIDFDTGSADLFLVYVQDFLHKNFNFSQSSTFQDQNLSFEDDYGSAIVKGELVRDFVQIAGVAIKNQLFGVATQISGSPSKPLAADGLMGLALGILSAYGATPWIENCILAGLLADAVFSVYLNQPQNIGGTASTAGVLTNAGEITFGGSDSSKYQGQPNFVPLTHAAYWQLQADRIDANGVAVPQTSFETIIDTGTSLIQLPTLVAHAVYTALPNGKILPSGAYSFPCSQQNTISVVLGGVAYPINPVLLNLGPVSPGSDYCGFAISGADIPGPNGVLIGILGDTFLMNVYTIFSYKGTGSVGFAPLASQGTNPSASVPSFTPPQSIQTVQPMIPSKFSVSSVPPLTSQLTPEPFVTTSSQLDPTNSAVSESSVVVTPTSNFEGTPTCTSAPPIISSVSKLVTSVTGGTLTSVAPIVTSVSSSVHLSVHKLYQFLSISVMAFGMVWV